MQKKSPLPMIGSCVTISAFVYLVYVLLKHAVPLNPASWIMWTVLDLTIAIGMLKAKQSSAGMMVAFTIGAGTIASITVLQLLTGVTSWTWGSKETLTAVCFVVTLAARQVSASDTLTMNIGATAMFIAGIPTLIDAWHNPAAQNALFWGMCAIGWIITIMGTPRSFGRWYMPIGGAILNGFIAALALGWIK